MNVFKTVMVINSPQYQQNEQPPLSLTGLGATKLENLRKSENILK